MLSILSIPPQPTIQNAKPPESRRRRKQAPDRSSNIPRQEEIAWKQSTEQAARRVEKTRSHSQRHTRMWGRQVPGPGSEATCPERWQTGVHPAPGVGFVDNLKRLRHLLAPWIPSLPTREQRAKRNAVEEFASRSGTIHASPRLALPPDNPAHVREWKARCSDSSKAPEPTDKSARFKCFAC